MTALRRLAILLSAGWVVFFLLAYLAEGEFRLVPFLCLGVVPVALVWGIAWVIAGLRAQRG